MDVIKQKAESYNGYEIEIKPELLTSTTDKILYNIGLNISSISSEIESYCGHSEDNGIKINGKASVDVSSVYGAIPVYGSVSVNNTVDTYVNNTVDVKVTNFPESGNET